MRLLGQRSLLFLGLLLLGCGPDFDPPDQLHSLRVLGVQKDVPYAKPGEDVHLQMLWEDASPKAGRKIQRTWTAPCFDPDGDLYYGCFSKDRLPSLLPLVQGDMPAEDTTQFTMPTSFVPSPGAPPQPLIRGTGAGNNAPYGVAFVFFAVCAGTLTSIPTSDATALPFACKDDSGNLLGSDDFVAGYTSVYSYDRFSNNNPLITGFEFNGQPLDSKDVCIGDTCPAIAEAAPPASDAIDCDAPEQAFRCVPTCSDDGKSPCHGYPIKPILAQAENQDLDSVSAAQLGRNVTEQMWIDYYTDAGGFKSPVRLLNDATNGWNDNYGTEFYAPKEADKVMRVWAVVHDNRGGTAWAGISLKTQ